MEIPVHFYQDGKLTAGRISHFNADGGAVFVPDDKSGRVFLTANEVKDVRNAGMHRARWSNRVIMRAA